MRPVTARALPSRQPAAGFSRPLARTRSFATYHETAAVFGAA